MPDNFPAYALKVNVWLSRKSMAKLGHLAVRDCPAGLFQTTRVGHIYARYDPAVKDEQSVYTSKYMS